VIRLGGSGPFHAFIFTACLGIRNPGGTDVVLPPAAVKGHLVGDDDLARCPTAPTVRFFSQVGVHASATSSGYGPNSVMFMGWNFSKKKVYSLPIFQWAGSTRKEKFPMGYYCRMDLAVVGDRVLVVIRGRQARTQGQSICEFERRSM
jgi:hypothetical protein